MKPIIVNSKGEARYFTVRDALCQRLREWIFQPKLRFTERHDYGLAAVTGGGWSCRTCWHGEHFWRR